MTEAPTCGHEQAPDEPLTCLVPDRSGHKHRVSRIGRHCMCHGWHLTRIEGVLKK